MIRVRQYRTSEFLPAPLLDTGMPFLDPEWAWVVTPKDSDLPFALVVTSFAHGWLVFWRVLSVQPLPSPVARNWFLEAMPKILENAKERGCVGLLTMLADNKATEAKLARVILRMNGIIIPFKGSIASSLFY